MQIQRLIILAFVTVLLGIPGAQFFASQQVSAAQVQNRSLTLSTSQAGATGVTYTVKFDIASSYTLGSIMIEFCVEDPLPNQPCTAPPGMSAGAATLGAQTGQTGFSSLGGGANRLTIGRAPSATSVGAVSYQFQNITNPSTANHTYFSRVYTYASNNGSGASIDDGGMTFATANQLGFVTEVPPYLQFCIGQTIGGLDCGNATGQFLDLGELSRVTPKFSDAQMLIATNAQFGAGVTATGTTLQSGNNVIPALATPTASNPGTSQFGFNMRDNSNPNVGTDPVGPGVASPTVGYSQPNLYKYVNGDIVATTPAVTDLKKFTLSFVTNIAGSQPPGVYNTTLTFICLANF